MKAFGKELLKLPLGIGLMAVAIIINIITLGKVKIKDVMDPWWNW